VVTSYAYGRETISNLKKRWKFERLSDDTGDQDEQIRREIVSKDEQLASKDQQIAEKTQLVGQKDEQLAQKDQQLVEQARQLANQSEQLADHSRQLVEQSRELADQSERMAEKDQETARAYRELGDRLAWVVQREDALRRAEDDSRSSAVYIQDPGSSVQALQENRRTGEQEQSEVATLREKVERLERLMARVMDQNVRMPNNMA